VDTNLVGELGQYPIDTNLVGELGQVCWYLFARVCVCGGLHPLHPLFKLDKTFQNRELVCMFTCSELFVWYQYGRVVFFFHAPLIIHTHKHTTHTHTLPLSQNTHITQHNSTQWTPTWWANWANIPLTLTSSASLERYCRVCVLNWNFHCCDDISDKE
jgi:hypothetical protein